MPLLQLRSTPSNERAVTECPGRLSYSSFRMFQPRNHLHPRQDHSPVSLRRITLLVFAVTCLAYVLLLTKNYYWDGIFFAQVIEDAPRMNATLIHPSHLVDQIFGYFAYRLARWVGLNVRALTVLQVSNCFLGAAAAVVFFRICADCLKSTYVSVVSTALFAFAATWWRFATDADAYVPTVLMLLITFYLLLPAGKSRPFLVAATHALAMLLHQLAVFFFPVAVGGLLLQLRIKKDKAAARNVLTYGLTAMVMTGGAYYLAFHFATGAWSIARFLSWITYYSTENGFSFNAPSNLTFTLRSQVRTLFGGRVAFVREFGGPAMATLAALTAIVWSAFFFVLLRRWRELRSAIVAAFEFPKRFKPLTVLCVVWIVAYAIFLFFFIPQNVFYRLLYLPAIILLIGAALATIESSPKHIRRYRAALFALALFLANLTFSQYPYTQARANPPLELALNLKKVWPTGTVVYYASPNTDGSLVRYFNPRSVWVQVAPEEIVKQSDQLPGSARSAWLDTTLIDQLETTREGREWLTAHTMRRSDCELINEKFRIRFYQLKADSFHASG